MRVCVCVCARNLLHGKGGHLCEWPTLAEDLVPVASFRPLGPHLVVVVIVCIPDLHGNETHIPAV